VNQVLRKWTVPAFSAKPGHTQGLARVFRVQSVSTRGSATLRARIVRKDTTPAKPERQSALRAPLGNTKARKVRSGAGIVPMARSH
jgi:hypothetical protein